MNVDLRAYTSSCSVGCCAIWVCISSSSSSKSVVYTPQFAKKVSVTVCTYCANWFLWRVRVALLRARGADSVAMEARRRYIELKGEYDKIPKCLGASQKAASQETKAATKAKRAPADI
jgi:hypothetical protein